MGFTFNAWSSKEVISKRGSKRVFHCSFLYCYCCQLWYGSEGVNRQRWWFGWLQHFSWLKGNGIVTLSFVLFLSDHLRCCESMKAFAVVGLWPSIPMASCRIGYLSTSNPSGIPLSGGIRESEKTATWTKEEASQRIYHVQFVEAYKQLFHLLLILY